MAIEGRATTSTGGRIRLGMVGGGEGAFIGAVHRIAARIDDHYDFVAGALSSTPEKARRSGAALGLDPARIYADYETMAQKRAARTDGIEAVAIVTPNHVHAPAGRGLPQGRHPRHLRQAADDDAEGRAAASRSSRRPSGLIFAADPQLHRLSAGAAGARDGRRRAISARSGSSRPNIRRTG